MGRAFLGQTVRVTITTVAGVSILADVASEDWLRLEARVGDEVAWHIDAGRIQVFPADEAWLTRT
jgi:hypothetical protein